MAEAGELPPRPPKRRVLLATAVSIALFCASWGLLHAGFFTHSPVVDTPVYQRYGNAMAHGQVPYRDFGVEYPPGALPVFVLPALGHPEKAQFTSFRRVFEALMLVCGIATVVLTALSLRILRRGPALPLLFLGAFPLLLGPVVLSRFDLWPAALAAAALLALLSARAGLGSALLGLAVAAKVYPAVAAPLAVAHAWRRGGRAAGLRALGFLAGAVAVVVGPFLALAPAGVWDSVVRQSTRPLQIESVGAAILLAAHHAFGLAITMRSSHGSQNLVGHGAGPIAAVQSVLEIAFLLGLWIAFARGPADRDRLVRYAAATVCGFVVLGKVLSPQFLIWLAPLVPLVRGRRGAAATALLAAAMLLTQVWFPYRYWDLALHFDATASWLVLARDLVLLGLLAALVWPEGSALRRRPGP